MHKEGQMKKGRVEDSCLFSAICFFKKVVFLSLLYFLLGAKEHNVKANEPVKSILSRCAVCHGRDGNAASNKVWPKLAGQNFNYLFKSLRDFRPNTYQGRSNAVMNALVATLSEKDMKEIAYYYAGLLGDIDAASASLLPRGQQLYRGGDLGKGIPACAACHHPAGLGNPPAGFPRLSGQHAAYIVIQLKAFRSGERNSDPHKMMPVIAKKMSDKDIKAVASYISGLYF